MPRSATAPVGMIDRFRYSPGDGHVYVWPGTGDDEIHVHRVITTDPWTTKDTGDRIDVAGLAPTTESMRAAVVLWKARKRATP